MHGVAYSLNSCLIPASLKIHDCFSSATLVDQLLLAKTSMATRLGYCSLVWTCPRAVRSGAYPYPMFNYSPIPPGPWVSRLTCRACLCYLLRVLGQSVLAQVLLVVVHMDSGSALRAIEHHVAILWHDSAWCSPMHNPPVNYSSNTFTLPQMVLCAQCMRARWLISIAGCILGKSCPFPGIRNMAGIKRRAGCISGCTNDGQLLVPSTC
jgi:hypothetical protein